MERIQLQGRAVTLRDQHRANFARPDLYQPIDFTGLREELDSRSTLSFESTEQLLTHVPADSDSIRYWRMADEFLTYAHCETKSRGTPSLATHMGF